MRKNYLLLICLMTDQSVWSLLLSMEVVPPSEHNWYRVENKLIADNNLLTILFQCPKCKCTLSDMSSVHVLWFQCYKERTISKFNTITKNQQGNEYGGWNFLRCMRTVSISSLLENLLFINVNFCNISSNLLVVFLFISHSE